MPSVMLQIFPSAVLKRAFIVLLFIFVCGFNRIDKTTLKLIILDPGHGHATFMQTSMHPEVNQDVYVYAPAGPDVQQYIASIERLNSRKVNPTNWKLIVYTEPDYLDKMLADKKGNTVLISGNNLKKSDYILRSVQAGLHVIADKPMAIKDFPSLEKSFTLAKQKGVLLFDPMDLRYDISNILQKELSQIPELFGQLQRGTKENPALIQQNLHHYLKGTSIRPPWFFDTDQQGHGIADVSTHLLDLNQWLSMPDPTVDYRRDIQISSAREWPTTLTMSEFAQVTKVDKYPEYLQKDIKDSILSVYSNGEINYTLKGIHSRVTVLWNYREPIGSSDTHYALMRGSKADLEIRQGKEEGYKATLYIQPKITVEGFEQALDKAKQKLQKDYPGTQFIKKGQEWEVKPGSYQRYNSAEMAIKYIRANAMPHWEVPNMLAKYFTTTEAVKRAVR